MDFLKPELLPWTLAFVLPGFVSLSVYDLLVPGPRREWEKSVLHLVAFGAANFALWFLAFRALFENAGARPWWFGWVLLLVLVVGPSLLGWMTTAGLQWAGTRGWIAHPFPTAWDAFFNRRQECWVLMHLKDGRLVGGWFAEGSFASAFPNERDLYVRDAWRIGDDGRFEQRIDDSLGIWISAKDCELIEFFESRTEASDGG